MKPVIGCLGVLYTPENAASAIDAKQKNILARAYTRSVAKNGGLPVIIPFTEDFDVLLETLRLCDGVILPGGGDADPALYGQTTHAACGKVDPAMDHMQIKALEYLYENRIPTLGICRGCQMMNIFTGGTLYQDLSLFPAPTLCHEQSGGPEEPGHPIRIEPGSRLHVLFGESTAVNSFHHQAAQDLGDGFSAAACSPDGVIEAIEHENGIWLGVQWHPEQMTDVCPEMNGVFRALLENCK